MAFSMDDMLPENHRITSLRKTLGPDGPAVAFGLLAAAYAYSSRNGLDGFIDQDWVDGNGAGLCRRPDEVIEGLLSKNLLERVEGGFQILNFLKGDGGWNTPASKRRDFLFRDAERKRRERDQRKRRPGSVPAASARTRNGHDTDDTRTDADVRPEIAPRPIGTGDVSRSPITSRARSLVPDPVPENEDHAPGGAPRVQAGPWKPHATPGDNLRACRRLIWSLIEQTPAASSGDLWFAFKREAVRAGLAIELRLPQLSAYLETARVRFAIRQLVESGQTGDALAQEAETVLRGRQALPHPDVLPRLIRVEQLRHQRLQRRSA